MPNYLMINIFWEFLNSTNLISIIIIIVRNDILLTTLTHLIFTYIISHDISYLDCSIATSINFTTLVHIRGTKSCLLVSYVYTQA